MKKIARMMMLTALVATGQAVADAPAQIRQQVPGYFRVAVGQYEVTALFDGNNMLSSGLLQGLTPEKVHSLLAQQKIDDERMPVSYNAFLINTGKHLVMIDSGAGRCGPASANQLIPNMKAAGYRPEQVDTIFLTHLHLDHVCGLSDASGRALFPNATVYIPQGEADFWLDTTKRADAPEMAQKHFAVAREALAPYQASGHMKTFTPPASPIAEVETVSAPGHTPGSTLYRFKSDKSAIAFIGDLIHAPAVQFPYPEVSIRFDVTPADAVKAREKTFTALAKEGDWVAAAHLPFPGMGHIVQRESGYGWIPALYGPYPQ